MLNKPPGSHRLGLGQVILRIAVRSVSLKAAALTVTVGFASCLNGESPERRTNQLKSTRLHSGCWHVSVLK